MTESFVPANPPTMALERAREILAAHGVSEAVALIGLRGFFPAMGGSERNDTGLYDDAIFLVTPEECRGYVANTDPDRLTPPNSQMKTGVWRYKKGVHVSPLTNQGHEALVQSQLPGEVVWLIARPTNPDEYRAFARKLEIPIPPGLQDPDDYRRALQALGGRLIADGVEWPMKKHINIHRGLADAPGSRACQTVHPSVWADFIGRVYRALDDHAQTYLSYVLLEADRPPRGQG